MKRREKKKRAMTNMCITLMYNCNYFKTLMKLNKLKL